ncbi:hypothetical protein E3C22_13515 [Jiella endophytica]|uniref:Chemotaxis protein n=1 Tax=Jiella endophytica TaxID=2558362 RepID=A0A4Y8RHH6_9HYPH|nr:hypothetical protein [Jiella endophytica]TFF21705.1 hypothetical protein E3C22_13515 [Jiella endophytica]
MRRRCDPLAPALAVAALLFAAPAHGEDAGHGEPSAAELVRQAGEAARRGDAASHGEAADSHGAAADAHDPHAAAGGHGAEAEPAMGDAHGMTGHDDMAHGATDQGEATHAEAGDGDAHSGDEAAAHGGDGHGEEGHGEATHEGDGHGADGGESEHGEAAEHHEPPPTRGPQPYEVIRSLQFLQDQAARGNTSANRVQARLLQWYGPAFERASQKTWEDGRNQRAAALFVLSGGPPSVLRMILAKNDFPPEVQPLLKGSLAYVENRQSDAEKLLSALDTEAMEPGLAAQINLAVAQLQEKDAPEKALERLRRVMLDASGTLLEEAALRLGMALADQLGQPDRADGYARLYFDRYARSVYAGNFRARFTAMYVARPVEEAVKTVHTLDDAVARIPLADQLNIYLSIGRRALVAGNMKLAGMAGERVLQVANLTQPARQRALLYVAASTLTEGDTGKTLASLESIDRESLHPADRKLYDAAIGVLQEIRKPLMSGVLSDTKRKKTATQEAALESPVIDRATKLLDAIRSDIEGTNQ